MRLPGRRLALVAAFLLVCGFAANAAETQQHYRPVEETRADGCWTCHSTWNPPVPKGEGGRHNMAAPIPPGSVGAVPGQEFDYTVQIQNTWRSDVTFMAPALDLTRAPSLRFGGGHPPDHNETMISITPQSDNLTEPQGKSITFTVPPAASFLSFTIAPRTTDPTTGPQLTLIVVTPTGAELAPVQAAAPGQSVTRVIEQSELDQAGAGTWRVIARFTPVDPAGSNPPRPPVLGRQDIDVIEDARFETAGLRVLALPRAEFLGPAASTLQTWSLVTSTTPPAPGETVRIYANVTVYYDHDGGPPIPGGDYNNLTAYVDAEVVTIDGQTRIVYNSAVIRPALLNGATATTISEVIGYAAAFLLISSIASGGMFGRASRRGLNQLFGSAKRRVAFHNFLSYGLTVAALAHTFMFVMQHIIPPPFTSAAYHWTWGLSFGGLAILSMVGLGVTGAVQVPMIRKWNYATWRWTHYGMTVTAILFTLVHMALDGANFGFVQDYLDWHNQLFPFETAG